MTINKRKVESVYDYLLSQLLNMECKPNTRLKISKIAEECGVSETPVREALRQLETEGYVEITPNRGATAVGFTKEKIEEISEIRGVLEGYLTRVSIDYLSIHDLRILENMNRQMEEAAKQNDYESYIVLNKQFHRSIYEHTHKDEWLRLIDQLWAKWSFMGNIFVLSKGRMSESVAEHDELLRLIKERKYEEVEAMVRMHKSKALEIWIGYLTNRYPTC